MQWTNNRREPDRLDLLHNFEMPRWLARSQAQGAGGGRRRLRSQDWQRRCGGPQDRQHPRGLRELRDQPAQVLLRVSWELVSQDTF